MASKEKVLANRLKGRYEGVLVSSGSKDIVNTSSSLSELSHNLIKVEFAYQNFTIVFRAMLTEQNEGVLMVIQQRTTGEFILSGINGFLYKKNNVHGGFIKNLDSFYFHLNLNTFDGIDHELYFLGKKKQLEEIDSNKQASTLMSI